MYLHYVCDHQDFVKLNMQNDQLLEQTHFVLSTTEYRVCFVVLVQ